MIPGRRPPDRTGFAVLLRVELRGGLVQEHKRVRFEDTDRALIVHMGTDVAGQQVTRRYPWANVVQMTTCGEVAGDAEEPVRCPDCGKEGERQGHMECQYPGRYTEP